MSHDPLLAKLFADALSRQSRGDYGPALLAYRRIQKQFPGFADAWANASVLLCGMGRPEEALAMAERAVALDGGNEVSLLAIAESRHRLGDYEEAFRSYAKVLDRNPGHVLAMLRMAEICYAAGFHDTAHGLSRMFDRALELSDAAARLDPGNAYAHRLRGDAKRLLTDYAGAEADLMRALELEPGYGDAHMGMVFTLLVTGRYREAWRHLRASGQNWFGAKRHDFGRPSWNGEPLAGKTLLVYAHRHEYCGCGDNIMYARFFPGMKERYGCRIALLAYGSLKRIFAGLPGLDEFVADGEPLPHFDVAVPMWEMVPLIGADLSDLPPPAALVLPPAPPPPELDRPGFKVGLTWSGTSRYLDPRLLDGLAGLPGAERVAWYGLQLPPGGRPPDLPGFTDLSHRMGDFLDTARMVGRMDLMVTVDTSMAHLAGTIGAPTIVLILQQVPEWRWGVGETTPWYPSVRLLRQPLREGPESVVRALGEEIGRRMR